MGYLLFFKGFLVGLSIAMPVGPIGMLCIRHSLNHGMKAGFISGLGAATADAVYGLLAGLSITAATDFLLGYRSPLQLVGSLFLLLFGIRLLLSKPRDVGNSLNSINHQGIFFSTFIATLVNPLSIMGFAALYAGLGLEANGSKLLSASTMTGGVFVGSATWWFALSLFCGLLRSKVTLRISRWLNVTAGIVMCGLAVLAVATAF